MRRYFIGFCLMGLISEAGANDIKRTNELPTISQMKKRADAYWKRLGASVDYLPLTGGELTGELVLNYSGARTIYQSASDVLAIGLWDGVNARIESSGRPLYLTSYGSSIKMGINGGNTLIVSGSNVGIGTTSPENLLHLHGNAVARFTNSTTGMSNSDGMYIGNASASSGAFDFWNYENGYLRFATNSTEQMRITSEGKIGIGTATPLFQLHTTGDISLSKRDITGTVRIGRGRDDGLGWVYTANIGFVSEGNGDQYITFSGLKSGVGGGEYMRIDPTGKIGIGTTSPSEKLSVNGNMRAKKIIVSQTGWPDYVFDSSYSLRSLSEVEAFITKNKHLPDMPSAKEVEEKGISVGDNQVLLLKKMEEMTLYMISMNKEIIQLKEDNKKLKKALKKYEK